MHNNNLIVKLHYYNLNKNNIQIVQLRSYILNQYDILITKLKQLYYLVIFYTLNNIIYIISIIR